MMKAVAVVLLSGAALCAGIVAIGHKEVATGEKMGVITKVAKQGFAFKTWEGEIVRGGLQGGNGVNGAAFSFTVSDDALATRAQQAMEAGKEVKIKYVKKWFTFASSESNDVFLTDFTIIDPKVASDGAPVVVLGGLANGDSRVRQGLNQEKLAKLLKTQGELLQVQAELIRELSH